MVVVQPGKNAETKTKLAGLQNDLKYTVDKIQFISSGVTLRLTFDEPTIIIIKKNSDTANKIVQAYFPILEGDVQSGT